VRAAVVGCGQIAGTHVSALNLLPGVEIAAFVDRDEQRARELAAGAPGASVFGDLDEMLRLARPDAVHVLTPPRTHAEIAIAAANAGCHVLVEKPMALGVAEAERMIAAADANGVTLSTSHNYLFKPSVEAARRLVEAGEIGDVIDVEVFYGVAGERSSYAGNATGSHWAWRLPGGVFTNFLPHVIYLELAFLGAIDTIHGVNLGTAPGEDGMPTELTSLVSGEGRSGRMTVSLRTRPYVKFVDVYGTRGILRADLVREVCTIHRDRRLPGMVAKVAFSAEHAAQILAGTFRSSANVALGRWQRMHDLHLLVRDFYESIEQGRPPRVTGRDGLDMAAVLEELWERYPALGETPRRTPPPLSSVARRAGEAGTLPKRALITGATGFLGSRLAEVLLQGGTEVVALTRDRTRVSFDLEQDARIVVGTLTDEQVLADALDGVDAVFHCAAVTTNAASWETHAEANVEGTAALLRAAAAAGVSRFVHVSSVIVYGLVPPDGRAAKESDAYGTPDVWDNYMRS
jgi:predicted dehydrogenase